MPQSTEIYTGGEIVKSLVEGLDEERANELLFSRLNRGLEKVFGNAEVMNACFCLFANDLNVSLTAGKLYMHRNTLIYRLNKIKRLCGLDLRKFPDAVDFLLLHFIYCRKKARGGE